MAITIRLHEIGMEIREIKVHPTDSIQILQKEVTGIDQRFIMFKNSILMTSFSFKFFGINDGDDLYVIRAPRKTNDSKKHKVLHNKSKNTHTTVDIGNGNVSIVDKSLIHECARILDLMYIKDERPRLYRRPSVLVTTNSKDEVTNTIPQTQESKATEPSTNCLPIFWPNKKNRLMKENL